MTFPIPYFTKTISADQILIALNTLVNDTNAGIATVSSGGVYNGPVSGLPTGSEGLTAFATNGRKINEGAGTGTGVPVYYSDGHWRVFSTDYPVAT